MDGKTVTVYVPYKNTMAYTSDIVEGAVHGHPQTDTMWVHKIIRAQDKSFYDRFIQTNQIPTELKHIINWFRETNSDDFRLVHPASRNRNTIHATKYGWVSMYNLMMLGYRGVKMSEMSIDDIYYKYDSDRGRMFVDPDTNYAPFCVETKHANIDFERDIFPRLNVENHDTCTVLARVIGSQIAQRSIEKISDIAGTNMVGMMANMMAMFGFACLPGERSLETILFLEGESGSGKGTLMSMILSMVGCDDCKFVEDHDHSGIFSTMQFVNMSTSRMSHVVVASDIAKYHYTQVIPAIKAWSGNDPGMANVKNSNAPFVYNTGKITRVSKTGGSHDGCPKIVIVNTNNPSTIITHEMGYVRRNAILSMKLPTAQPDSSLKKTAARDYMVEMGHCIWVYGTFKVAMDTPDDSGRQVPFRNVRLDTHGKSIQAMYYIDRMNEIIESSGVGSFNTFIVQHMEQSNGQHTLFDDVYVSYSKMPRSSNVGKTKCEAYCKEKYPDTLMHSGKLGWEYMKLSQRRMQQTPSHLPSYQNYDEQGDDLMPLENVTYFKNRVFKKPIVVHSNV
jgi:hypothetical protein